MGFLKDSAPAEVQQAGDSAKAAAAQQRKRLTVRMPWPEGAGDYADVEPWSAAISRIEATAGWSLDTFTVAQEPTGPVAYATFRR